MKPSTRTSLVLLSAMALIAILTAIIILDHDVPPRSDPLIGLTAFIAIFGLIGVWRDSRR